MSAPALQLVEEQKPFNLTDIGNAERFVHRHGHNVRWVPAWNRWILFDEKRWIQDETLEVGRLAKETVRAIWEEEIPHMSGGMRKDAIAHATASEKNAR